MTTSTVLIPDTDSIYVAGGWRAATGDERIDVRNPATEEVIADIPSATEADIDAACVAAAGALPAWAATPHAERAAVCTAIADGLEKRADELTALMTADLGMPLPLSRPIQVGLAINDFRGLAAAAVEHRFERAIGNSTVRSVPVGVVGAITPWNFPLHQIAAKVGGALAAGAPVVLKPAGATPLGAFVLAQIIDELDLPAGVFNLVTGAGSRIGEALVRHPLVDMISFTGSTGAGARVASLAGERVRPTALELGGKSPAVILDDLDDAAFEKTLRRVMSGSFVNSGQMCSALTRVVVPAHRLASAEEILSAAAATFPVGDPTAKGTRMGPMVTAGQRETVRGFIDRAVADGVRLVQGGSDTPDGLDRGYYVRPTVFSDPERRSEVSREEVFGPVLVLQTYIDVDHAVEVANDTRYGLAAGVWGADAAAADAVARRIRAGQVEVNGGQFNTSAPFGGFGDSGYGREFGPFGLEDFLTTQSIQH
ncbi:aldehyde dehydrogenase family protein [Gordonia hydrophobica]|uniref:aldehyde dehydrogenase (NAD(+)) n=1 Tax=Gordonia hydrophobica TaxID=40516 RepID=A0ABZ2TY04_9ACTN|nr:aldehyde dehydrogenase family protein [Gordonia hydrophobica]MBM7366565.1 acyl-CoA reductase-like NAD-dependent aldehyde dehydrogenase [Gordonia hydrophobica]